MQVTVRCTGDTVAGNGSKNVVLRMDTATQGGISSANDDWRFTVAPDDPSFGVFTKGNLYTVTVSPQ